MVTPKDEPVVGSIGLLLYVGMEGETPSEVGKIRLPITTRHVNGKASLSVQVDEALSYVGASLEQVFSEPEGTVARAARLALGLWDGRGGSMWFDREEWGVIVDALVQHRGESTSDVRADMCADLIERINAAAAQIGEQS